MSDPLRDPRFPDRPQHPDFWRLADVTTRLDGGATEGGKTIEQVAEGVIDLESLSYAATQRVGLFLQALGYENIEPEVVAMLETVFVTSVITGIEFQKAGGTRAE